MTEARSARVLREDSGVITGEHTVFVVRGDDDNAVLAPPWDGNTLVTVVDDGSTIGDLWVNTGDQWGPYAVTTRLLDGPPAEPAAEWEDVVEISIQPTANLVVTEMIDNTPMIALVDGPGDFRLRVNARGRIADRAVEDETGADGDDMPIEWYLLEVWPAPPTDPAVLRMTSSYADRLLNPPAPLVIPEGAAGLAAAQRIGRDIDDKRIARTLSGEVGSVRVERTIIGTRRRLFRLCAHLTTWSHVWLGTPSWSWSSGPHDLYTVGVEHWAHSGGNQDQLTGSKGAARWTFVEVTKPERVVRTWNWIRRSGGRGPSPFFPGTQVLETDSILTITLSQSKRGETTWTTIAIDHEGLPVEWLGDMETYWSYQLSIADRAGFGESP